MAIEANLATNGQQMLVVKQVKSYWPKLLSKERSFEKPNQSQ